jgi:hypothetical protein
MTFHDLPSTFLQSIERLSQYGTKEENDSWTVLAYQTFECMIAYAMSLRAFSNGFLLHF